MFNRVIAIAVLCVLLLSSNAMAADDIAADENVRGGPFVKLGRGLTNVIFSGMEIPSNVQRVVDVKGPCSGFFEGMISGVFYMSGRILSGVYDVVTFPIPLPFRYGALMKPDYVFDSVTMV